MFEEKKADEFAKELFENTMAGIKRLRSVTDSYRNKRSAMADTVMELACGLWNFHIEICNFSFFPSKGVNN